MATPGDEGGTLSDQAPRFFLRVPAGYFDMTEDEQQAATRAMWREVMTQIGANPDRLVSENAQDDPHDAPGA